MKETKIPAAPTGRHKSRVQKKWPTPEASTPEVAEPDIPRADPATVAAEIMLLGAFRELGLELQAIRRRGTIVLLITHLSEWSPFFCEAWKAVVSGGHSRDGKHLPSYFKSNDDAFIFLETDKPRGRSLEESSENFAAVVHRAGGIVGISAEPEWLPSDLVAAADHRIVLGPLTDGQVILLAKRVTGGTPSAIPGPVEAGLLTPRLLRLAARPDASADDYILMLRRLLVSEASSTDVAVGKRGADQSVRSAPTLERLHGMREAVSWGMALRDDIEAYRAGKRKWSDVDRGLLLSGPPGTGENDFCTGTGGKLCDTAFHRLLRRMDRHRNRPSGRSHPQHEEGLPGSAERRTLHTVPG